MKIFLVIVAIFAGLILANMDRIRYYDQVYSHASQIADLPKLKSFENLNIHYSFISANKDLLNHISLLKPMDRKGKVLVCIISQVQLSDTMRQHIETNTDEAVNDWNSLLNSPGVPWNRENIAVSFVYANNSKPCSEEANLIFTITAERIRPYAMFLMKSIFIGIDDLMESTTAKTALIHEIGHIIGLSDTYSDIDNKQIIGYPISIMSTSRSIDKISRSDHEAITQLWNYINLDIGLCETVDGKQLKTVNWKDSYTCVSPLEFGISSLVWGEDRSLTNNKGQLSMLRTGSDPRQLWVAKRVKHTDGYHLKLRHKNLCLNLISQEMVNLVRCSKSQKQVWTVEAWRPMIYFIKNELIGDSGCLTLHPNRPRLLSMQRCQNYKNMLWMINNHK